MIIISISIISIISIILSNSKCLLVPFIDIDYYIN